MSIHIFQFSAFEYTSDYFIFVTFIVYVAESSNASYLQAES